MSSVSCVCPGCALACKGAKLLGLFSVFSDGKTPFPSEEGAGLLFHGGCRCQTCVVISHGTVITAQRPCAVPGDVHDLKYNRGGNGDNVWDRYGGKYHQWKDQEVQETPNPHKSLTPNAQNPYGKQSWLLRVSTAMCGCPGAEGCR